MLDRNNCILGSTTSTTLKALDVVYLHKLIQNLSSFVNNNKYQSRNWKTPYEMQKHVSNKNCLYYSSSLSKINFVILNTSIYVKKSNKGLYAKHQLFVSSTI